MQLAVFFLTAVCQTQNRQCRNPVVFKQIHQNLLCLKRPQTPQAVRILGPHPHPNRTTSSFRTLSFQFSGKPKITQLRVRRSIRSISVTAKPADSFKLSLIDRRNVNLDPNRNWISHSVSSWQNEKARVLLKFLRR